MGSTKISEPAQPTASQTAEEYAKALPIYYQSQLEYSPLIAQQQVDLLNQYSGQIGEAMLNAQKSMYPEEYALKEDLMKQAQEGMTADMPDWMKEQYQDTFRANLGTNAGSGIGADYVSRNMLAQQQAYNDHYRNMAMSLSGTQPVYQAGTPSYLNALGNYTPTSNMNFAAQNYGTAANIYGTSSQIAMNNANMPFKALSGVGNLLYGWGQL